MRYGKVIPGLTRRQALGGALAALVAGRCEEAKADAPPALRELAAAKGILYGSCVQEAQLAAHDDFTALLLRECAAIVPENEMKWQWMSHRPGEEDFSIPDRIVDFATRFRLAARGHNLLWYWRTPDWYKALPDRASAEGALLRRVTEMCRRYRRRVFCWDVVNEPIYVEHGRDDTLRRTVFLHKVGDIELGDLDVEFQRRDLGQEVPELGRREGIAADVEMPLYAKRVDRRSRSPHPL